MALPEALRSRLTWEQYLRTPESMERVEIEDGQVKPMASPTGRHQMVLGNLHLLLAGHPAVRARGTVLIAPFDVVIARRPLRVRQPDLLFVSHQRVPAGELVNAQRLEAAPDMVVEILSPSDTFAHLARKLGDYHRLGVQEARLLDVEQSQVFVLSREERGWHWQGPFVSEQKIPSTVLPEVSLTAKAIFEGG
ncbi:MAG: Uma2 family endonuclease [Armatimonadota bacterium]|nr:Uma2 family endonuclease [bacterium]MDW8321307.1 Uma2 family endonuclease [Armatimonadota bacterium]